jgi:APA family basic amino acid/polyamine antiporter
MDQSANSGLIRGIRRWDMVAVAINAVIGAGIFGLPSKVYALIGPYSLAAFIVCALVVTMIILCFAEVSSRFSETGGPYLYAREAFGPIVGFEVGWLMWLARLTAFTANCNLLVEYLSYFWPPATTTWPRAIVITSIVLFITTINVIGVRDVAMFSNIFTLGKLIPIALFIAAGLFFLNPQNFTSTTQPGFHDFSQSVLLLVYAFTGFEIALIPAGEARDPERDMPFAILTMLGIVVLVYILIQMVCIGTLPGLAESKRPLADAARNFLGSAGASLITAGAITSIFGNLSVVVLAAARLPFAMAGRRELPRIFAAIHGRFHTPYVAIVATCAAMLALTLFGSFIYGVTVSTIARLLAYGATCIALLVLRRRSSQPPFFRAPAGALLSISALALMAWLLSNSTRREALDAGIAAAAGLIIYAVYKSCLKPGLKQKMRWRYKAKSPMIK